MTRAITIVIDEPTALAVSEACSIRCSRLLDKISRGIDVGDPRKAERLSIAARVIDAAIIQGDER